MTAGAGESVKGDRFSFVKRGIFFDISMATPPKEEAPSLWRPLRTPIFRQLLVADVVSDIGTFMQGVGAAWLMVSLGAGPMYVALTQTASTLPFFLLALPAGSIGDIVDRRKLILGTEAWMVCVALALAVATLTGVITPWILLVLTFALSAGDAFETPTWRAVLPELVRKDDLPAASALNGIEFNIARAVGPALAGVLIAAAGVGAAFLVNVASFQQKVPHVNPVDNKSMNRFYPGKMDGTQTERASYLITKQVIEQSDHLIDLHGGDLDENLRPYSYWTVTGNKQQDDASRAMVLVKACIKTFTAFSQGEPPVA